MQSHARDTVGLIPKDVLFGPPDRTRPMISPDGTKLAYLAPVDGILNIWVGPLNGEAKPVTEQRARPIIEFGWTEDSRRLVFLQDTAGDENFQLYVADGETGDIRNLTPHPGTRAGLIGTSPLLPNTMLIRLNLDDPAIQDAYHLDLGDGSLTKVADNVGSMSCAFDADLMVRATARLTAEGVQTLVRSADADWRVLVTESAEDLDLSAGPVAVTADGTGLVVLTATGANATRLVELDLPTGATRRVLLSDDRYDVSAVVVSDDRTRIDFATVVRERAELVAVTPAYQADVAALRRQLGGDLSIVSRDRADQAWIVAETLDTACTTFHLYDRASKAVSLLFHSKPALDSYDLQPVEPFAFTARDGLEVHGYLTFPCGGAREKLPTVFWVHGGPWARDVWGLNPFVQVLANRGYLCVQVNYRGSSGYGKEFLNAGNREWAAAMHDDLVDAVNYLVEQGFAEKSKVAITGGSYGGYAALVGATFTPDVFCAAVDLVGPSNLNTMIRSFPPYWGPMLTMWHHRVGNPEIEEELLWSRSPLSRVGDIKIPLLIVQGANDPRVVKSESDQIVAALEERGIPHTYIVFDDEGHGFARPDNLIRFVGAMEKFLAEHVGGRAED